MQFEPAGAATGMSGIFLQAGPMRRLAALFSAYDADFTLDSAENTGHIIRILCGVYNVYLGKTGLADTHLG